MPNYEDLISPVRKAMTDLYKFRRRGHEGVVYDGHNFGDRTLACVPDPAFLLSTEGLEFQEGQARDALDTVLHIAFCLGMEQGRREVAREHRPIRDILAQMRKR